MDRESLETETIDLEKGYYEKGIFAIVPFQGRMILFRRVFEDGFKSPFSLSWKNMGDEEETIAIKSVPAHSKFRDFVSWYAIGGTLRDLNLP